MVHGSWFAMIFSGCSNLWWLMKINVRGNMDLTIQYRGVLQVCSLNRVFETFGSFYNVLSINHQLVVWATGASHFIIFIHISFHDVKLVSSFLLFQTTTIGWNQVVGRWWKCFSKSLGIINQTQIMAGHNHIVYCSCLRLRWTAAHPTMLAAQPCFPGAGRKLLRLGETSTAATSTATTAKGSATNHPCPVIATILCNFPASVALFFPTVPKIHM